MKSFRPGLALLALLIAIVWVYATRISKRTEETHVRPPAMTEVAPLPNPAQSTPPPPAMPLPSSQTLTGRPEVSINAIRFPVLPKLPQIIKEVGQNPHGLPPSLMDFAASLGKRMESALADENEATKFFPELSSCVLAKSGQEPSTAQALCLENARVLSEKYDTLDPEYRALKAEADPSVLKLAE